jgi:ectonucleotide pyrophosphatase/phosphodiesterase family protein 5
MSHIKIGIFVFIIHIFLIKFNLISCKYFDDYGSNENQQRLMVISLGGFRHDFISIYNLKNFARLCESSAKSPYLNPQFATQSLPNHWSMATGSFVETHGIVADQFYDPSYNEFFVQNRNDLKFYNQSGLEPIWYTAVEKTSLKTKIISWPGADSFYFNSPSLYSKTPYSEINSHSFNQKLNESVRLFEKEGYKFVMLYHNQPDSIAHKYGLNSAEFNVTLQQMDLALGHFLNQMKKNGILNSKNFNLIIVSDHGMTEIRKNIVINDYFDESDAQIWSLNRNLIHLKPLIGLDLLIKKLSKMPDVTINLKDKMPDRLHYKNNERIGDIILSAIEGVGFVYVPNEPLQMNGKKMHKTFSYEQKKSLYTAIADKASHGYDKIYPSMKGIFIAHGAMFKKNYSSEQPFENVDLYPLMCSVLSIPCDFNRNGSFDTVEIFLRQESRLITQYKRQFSSFSNLGAKRQDFNFFNFVNYAVLSFLCARF